jgi:hypothetical protein
VRARKLTDPQLWWLRKAVAEGQVHVHGSPNVRVARTLASLGVAVFDEDNSVLSPTGWGREVAERGGLLERAGEAPVSEKG